MSTVTRSAARLAALALLSFCATSQADLLYSQDFAAVNPSSTAATLGMIDLNRSTLPKGSWGPGNTDIFTAQGGAATSYFANSYEASGASDSGSAGSISDWLITPIITIRNNLTFTFYAQANIAADFPSFADSLQLRMCSGSMACSNISGSSTTNDAGLVTLFSQLLLNINPTFSATDSLEKGWTQYTATLTGLTGTTQGRFALRYFVDDVTTHGNYIGVDSISVTAVPEPESLMLASIGLSAMGLAFRRKTIA